MKSLLTLSLAVAVAAIAPAGAQTTPAASDATAQSNDAPRAKPKKERKICRSQTQVNSHLNAQTCHTAAEWQALDQQGGDASVTGAQFTRH